MDTKTQKPGATAKALGVTGATLRNYCKKFRPFLSDHATAKTGRRYTQDDITLLRHASSLLRQGLSYSQVSEQLEQTPITGEILDETPPATEEEQPESQGEIITPDFFNAFLEQLQTQHQSALDAKSETISELKSDKKHLQKENAWLRLPWWRRLFQTPPGE